MNLAKIRSQTSTYFAKRPEVEVAYLFGSKAKGEEGPLSDIDLAILVDEEKVPRNLPYGYKAHILTELMGVLKTEVVDLVLLNQSPLLLRFRVIHDGVILDSKDERKRTEFEASTMRLFFDRQYYYRRHARATIDRMAIEGIL